MASEWVLALEQNQKSEVTQGSSAATAEAVRNGADLRLFLIAQGYEKTLYFQQTYVGENDTFAGLMTHTPGCRDRRGQGARCLPRTGTRNDEGEPPSRRRPSQSGILDRRDRQRFESLSSIGPKILARCRLVVSSVSVQQPRAHEELHRHAVR